MQLISRPLVPSAARRASILIIQLRIIKSLRKLLQFSRMNRAGWKNMLRALRTVDGNVILFCIPVNGV